jgi:putative ABC transport system permease protein
MSVASETARDGRGGSLALRYAVRELRGGLRGFYVFIACIALGVMAIAGVGSVAASLGDGLAREGRTLLGGDAAFSLIQREAKPDEVAFLHSRGEVSVAATLRAMARAADGRLALVELKAVDGHYPMLGKLTLDPAKPVADLLADRDGAFGAAVDQTLLARLDLKLGDRVSIGNASFQIRSVVATEPDKLAGGIGLGPRFLVSETALRATGLLQPGSLVRWIYRVKLPDGGTDDRAIAALVDAARAALPEAGWEIRTRDNASPQLERSIDRFTQFLTLVGLAALLVGGVGVANAVKSHIDRRRDVIAAFKALGATGRDVFTIYLTQVIVLALIGSAIGLAVGAALPFVIVGTFGKLLPLPVVPALHPGELALSFVYGLLTALAFGLWPLGRVHDVPVAALFRETVIGAWHRPRWRYLASMAVVIAVLVVVVIGLAYDKRIAAVFVVSSIVVFALLRGIGAGAQSAPQPHHHAAAGDRQHPSARRVDAVGGNVTRPGSSGTGHDHPDRRQSAASVPGGTAGPGAVVLFHRYSFRRSQPLRRVPQTDRAAIDGRRRANAARAHRRSPRGQGGRPRRLRRQPMGAAERPRPDLHRRHPERLEDRRGQMVGSRL